MPRTLSPILFAALLAAGCSGDPSETGATANDLRLGQCVTPVNGDRFVSAFTVGSCDEPYRAQVLGRYEAEYGAYPGNATITRDAYDACVPFYERFTGRDFWTAPHDDITTITPGVSAWEEGDRVVVCLLVDVDGDLLEGSRAKTVGASSP